jgi:hypothetical protein
MAVFAGFAQRGIAGDHAALDRFFLMTGGACQFFMSAIELENRIPVMVEQRGLPFVLVVTARAALRLQSGRSIAPTLKELPQVHILVTIPAVALDPLELDALIGGAGQDGFMAANTARLDMRSSQFVFRPVVIEIDHFPGFYLVAIFTALFSQEIVDLALVHIRMTAAAVQVGKNKT